MEKLAQTIPETRVVTESAARAGFSARRVILAAAAGVLGGLATAQCILSLILLAVGLGAASAGTLGALAPYQPILLAIAVGSLGYGYYFVYWRPRKASAEGETSARPVPSRRLKVALWIATVVTVGILVVEYFTAMLVHT